MTESRYPGLDQANGDHRDSFATRFAGRSHGYDPDPQPEAGSGGGSSGSAGSPAGPASHAGGNASPGNGSHGYDPAATQFSFAPLDPPTAATPGPASPPPPSPPVSTGRDSGTTQAVGPDSGTTRAVGPDSGATRAVPADFSGYDLSKIGGTSTYGTPAGGTSRAPSYGSGFTGSVTGYDPANYAPPSSYGQGHGSGDGATYRVGRDGSVKKLGVDTQTGLPPTPAAVGRSSLSSATAARGPRRARLQLKHIDPWSTMKFSLVLSVAMFVVWMIAVGLLYGVLGGMGVWDKVNQLYDQVAGGNLITASFVLGSAAVIGAINIVLFTALATVGSFVYNLCSDLVGGIELTLSERD